MIDAKCKICRRVGEKLFLKGERCLSPKCAMVRRPYPAGQKGKRRKGPPSAYGLELKEKQKLRNWYNLEEKQFKNYVKNILAKRGKIKNAADLLIQTLELRLDNVIYRMGLTFSRNKSRQMVSHGIFTVNGKTVNIASYQVKKGDVISLRKSKADKKLVKEMKELIKKQKAPSWIQLDPEKLEAKIIGSPNLEEVSPPVEVTTVFEFYSK